MVSYLGRFDDKVFFFIWSNILYYVDPRPNYRRSSEFVNWTENVYLFMIEITSAWKLLLYPWTFYICIARRYTLLLRIMGVDR